MLKHVEWRKIAKKERRKRKRRAAATVKAQLEAEEQERRDKSPSYQRWLKEQEQLEDFQRSEELRIANEQEALFQQREKLAKEKWEILQKKLQKAQEARALQNIRIKEEWEAEQKRIQAVKEAKARQEEEQLLQEQRLQQQIDEFIEHNGEMPQELNALLETNPGKVACPFFSRTGACRFGDMCSRNHKRPTISCILLVKNFYSHYSLVAKENEHGDLSLEYENHEIYRHFSEFFHDAVPEFEKYGAIKQFKVCCNKEAHLRGNVYVEYSSCQEAMRSYRRFQGRFYAGKQLNVEFCTIDSWKAAVCGLFHRKRCPKGSVCNFLHVFWNPGNMFMKLERRQSRGTSKRETTDDWNDSERSGRRWSSSPETPTLAANTLKEVACENEKRTNHDRHRSESRHRSSRRSSSRSYSRSNKHKHRRRSRSKSKSSSSTSSRKFEEKSKNAQRK